MDKGKEIIREEEEREVGNEKGLPVLHRSCSVRRVLDVVPLRRQSHSIAPRDLFDSAPSHIISGRAQLTRITTTTIYRHRSQEQRQKMHRIIQSMILVLEEKIKKRVTWDFHRRLERGPVE